MKILAWLSLVLAALGVLFYFARSSGTQSISHPGQNKFVQDQANLLDPERVAHLDEYLAALLRDTDIELMVLSLPSLKGQTAASAAGEVFESWKVGSRSKANRGVLFLVAVNEQQVRFSVSYGLEAIFPDAFISYIEHEQMLPYFNQGSVGIGFEATIEMIAGRGFQKVLQKAYNPQESGQQTVMGYHQGGAGAQTAVKIGSLPAGGNEMNLSQNIRAYFSAQPSAEQAWQRFLEINSRQISDPELGLYSEESKQMLRSRPYTKAAMDSISKSYQGKKYIIREKEGRAAITFPDDPNHLLAPWFFQKSADGWQFDGKTFMDTVQFNHLNQWRFKQMKHPYTFAFDNYSFDKHGFAFYKKPRTWLGCSWYWTNYQGSGVLVINVTPGTPAEIAGIEVGDYIMSIEGQSVSKPAELSKLIRSRQAGDKVKLEIVRGALTEPVKVRLDNGQWQEVAAKTVLDTPKKLTLEPVLSLKE